MKKASNNSERVRFSYDNLSWGLHFRLCIALLRGSLFYKYKFDKKFMMAVMVYIDGLDVDLKKSGFCFKNEVH